MRPGSGTGGRNAAVFALACLAALGAGCSEAAPDTARSDQSAAASADSTTLDAPHPEQFPLARAEIRDVADALHLTGVVAPDVSRSVPVLSLGGGRVVDLRHRLGDDVKRGEVLVRIESPDLAAALADYKKFSADAALARRRLERADSLYAHGVIAEKDVEEARNAAEDTQVDLAAAADRVHVLGGTVDQSSPILEVRAPISGTIVEQNVTAGTGVRSLDNSPNLFTVADLSRVWVLCDVYENALARVHPGDPVDVSLAAYPGRNLEGRVGDVSRVLDPGTRSAKLRIELPNPGGVLRAGMFVTASVRSRRPVPRVLLPSAALLRLHDRDWVFRKIGAGRFRRIQVRAGSAIGDGLQEVLSGVGPGDTVVANALQFASALGAQ